MPKKIYVPILKWKKGEQEALKNLSQSNKDKITPLIEITDYQSPEILESNINSCFSDSVYIDTLIAAEDDRDFLISIISTFKNHSKEAYPVVYFDDLDIICKQLTNFSEKIAIKIPVPEDIDAPSNSHIFDSINNFKKNNDITIDIILDLGFVDKRSEANLKFSELKSTLNLLNGKSFFDKIIISSTSFPESLSSVPSGGISLFDRYDFKIFNKIKSEYSQYFKDKIIYSDYGVTKFTDSDVNFAFIGPNILPKVRYTTYDTYWVLKGKKDRINKLNSITYKNLATKVKDSEFYLGKDFCFGDLEIYERATGEKGCGNHQNWVTISANHHIAVVVEQLSKSL